MRHLEAPQVVDAASNGGETSGGLTARAVLLRRGVLGALVAATLCYPLVQDARSRVLIGVMVRLVCVVLLVVARLPPPVRLRRAWRAAAWGLVGVTTGFALDGFGLAAIGAGVSFAAFGVLVLAAYSFMSSRREGRPPNLDILLEAAAVVGSAVIMLHHVPGWHVGLDPRGEATASALLGVAALAIGGRALLDRITPTVLWLLAGAAASMTTGGLVLMVTGQGPGAPTGAPGALFFVPNLFLAAAALHPSRQELATPLAERSPGTIIRKLPTVAAALIAPLAVLVFDSLRHTAPTGLDLAAVAAVVVLVTARLGRALLARDRADQRLTALLSASLDGISILGPDGTILFEGGQTIRRFSPGPDGNAFSLLHPDDLARALEVFARIQATPGSEARVELRTRRPGGEDTWYWVECRGVNRMDDPAIGGIVVSIRETTERHDAAARLEHRASHDPLTGLPNRVRLLERLTEALERNRATATKVAVLFCDLDRFKLINDSLGHRTGDAVLRESARRLSEATRPDDVVTRFGGDEFVVICEGLETEDDAQPVAERLRSALTPAFHFAGRDLTLSASVGIAVSRGSRSTANTLLRDADAAMYRAKELGRNRVVQFDSAMRDRVVDRLDTERQLRAALAEGQLEVHYQPIVRLADRTLSGFEALVRWNHPERGLLGPDQFLDVARDAGLMIPIGQFVVNEGLSQLARWRAEPTTAHLRLSLNLSVPELSVQGVADEIASLLDRYDVPADAVVVEVTEEALIDHATTGEAVRTLHALGVKIALDDFGTGYSSLSYLLSLPVEVIKLDKAFIQRLGDGGDPIVAAVVQMAHSLGLRVIAEGIETEMHHVDLLALGADYGQGWLFGRPAPAHQVILSRSPQEDMPRQRRPVKTGAR